MIENSEKIGSTTQSMFQGVSQMYSCGGFRCRVCSRVDREYWPESGHLRVDV